MIFRENLPPRCPPNDALHVEETRTFYRLVKGIPPDDTDFQSRWQERPDLRPNWMSKGEECDAKGLSVFDNPAAANSMTKYPDHRNKVVRGVEVTPQSGPIKQGRSSHYTWWPYRDYNILDHDHGQPP